MTDYREVFENIALQNEKRGNKYKDENKLELSRYYYSLSVPYFCESAVLARIYGDIDKSDKCIAMALDIKEKISSNPNNFSSSISSYAEAIFLAFKNEYEKCIENLLISKKYLNNSEDEYDPLFHSWIFCELGYCYKKINKNNESIENYLCGFILLKSIEVKNSHYKSTRKYLQNAILSKPENIYSDIIKDLNEIAVSSKKIGNYELSSIYYCEVAILQKVKGMHQECRESIENAINLIELIKQKDDYFANSTINYINGVSCSLKSDFHRFDNKIPEADIELNEAINYFNISIEILKIRNVDHFILFTFLSREIAYSKYRLEMFKNLIYFYHANKVIKELDWILTLYERTLGLFYNFIGHNQMYKLLSKGKIDDNFISINNLKNRCTSYDEKLSCSLGHLAESECKNLKVELDQMKEPIFCLEKSLNYLADVNDEIVVAATHMDISQIYVFRENIYRAKLELENASKYFINIKNDYIQSQFHHACAYIMDRQRNYGGAELEYSKALEFAIKVKNERAQIIIYNNIVPILMNLQKLDEALKYCENGIKIIESYNEISRDKFILTKLYLNYCILNVMIFQNYDISMDYLEKARQLNDPSLANSIDSVKNWINLRKQGFRNE